MKMPSFSGVRLPKGAVYPNLPFVGGVGLSAVLFTAIMLTGEPPIQTVPDPLDQPAIQSAALPDALANPLAVQSLGNQVDRQVADLTQNVEAQRLAREQAELQRQRAEAAEQQRVLDELAEARRTLELLRATPSVVSSTGVPAAPIMSEEEAALQQAMRIETMERHARAPRAAMVVSSARGLSPDRSHALPAGVDPRAGFVAAPPAAPVAPSAVPGPPQTAPGVPLGVPGSATLPYQGPPGTFPPGSFPEPPAAPPGLPPGAPPTGVPPSSVPQVDATRGGPVLRAPVASGGFAAPAAAPNPSPVGVVVYPDDPGLDRIYEGTLVNTVLQTQLSGEFPGPVQVLVNRHFYSSDRRRVLIPKGTKFLGSSQAVSDPDQGRLAVGFHRMVFPDGRWVTLEFGGLNGIGETGLRDQVNRRYLQTFGTAGAVGLLTGFMSRGSDFGTMRSGVADQSSLIGMQILQRHLNRLPEITIRAGHRVNVRFMQDVLIPRADAWVIGSPTDG